MKSSFIAVAMGLMPMAAMAHGCPAALHIQPPTIAQIEHSGVHPTTGYCAGRVSKVMASSGRMLITVEEHYTHKLAIFSLPASGRQYFYVGRVVKLRQESHGIAVIPVWGGHHRPILNPPLKDLVSAR